MANLVAFTLAYPALAADTAVNAVIFGSLDAGSSVFVNTGFKAAPDRVDREGFAGLAVIGSGARMERRSVSENAPASTALRATVLGSALGGYQFFHDWGVVGLFAGPEVASETLIDHTGLHVLPTRFGLRTQSEVWARTTENTLTTLTLILGTARWDAYGRVSTGYRLCGSYMGPEIAAYVDRTGYQKWSAGLHATEFRFGDITFRLSSGFSYEVETHRAGPYFALAGWMAL